MTSRLRTSRARAQWLAEPFPPGSDRDDLDEIHASLAYWDTWVASQVLPFDSTGVWQEPVLDLRAGLLGILGEIQEAGLRTPDAAQDLMFQYRRYAENLLDVVAAAEALVADRRVERD